MDYRSRLESFSKQLQKVSDPKSPMMIYKRNHLMGLVERIREAYPSVYTSLEFGNFRFLVKDFSEKVKIESPDIVEYLELFPDYLEDSFNIHQEKHLSSFARLDWLFTNSFMIGSYMDTPKGLFFRWQALLKGDDSKVDIKDHQFERIQVVEKDGKRSLMLLGSAVRVSEQI